jgi:hypothetical protein
VPGDISAIIQCVRRYHFGSNIESVKFPDSLPRCIRIGFLPFPGLVPPGSATLSMNFSRFG